MAAGGASLRDVICRSCRRRLPVRYEIRGDGTVEAWCRKCKLVTTVMIEAADP